MFRLYNRARALGRRAPSVGSAVHSTLSRLARSFAGAHAPPAPHLAHVVGDRSVPLLAETIGARFAHVVQLHGDRPALVVADQAVRWSYAKLDARARAAAVGLLELGLRRGDRLAVWMPNCSEWLVLQLASAMAGVVLVSLNPAYRAAELHHALTLAGCKALVLAPGYGGVDFAATLRELAPELASEARGGDGGGGRLHAERLPELEHVLLAGGVCNAGGGAGRAVGERSDAQRGMLPFEALLGDGGDGGGSSAVGSSLLGAAAATLSQSDPINIQFTSGTTGLPKAATLTHRNILNNGYFIGRGLGLTEFDRVCLPVPLFHCFGSVLGNLACLTHGAAMVYPGAKPNGTFDAAATLTAAAAERCTALYGVPTMFIQQLALPGFAQHDLSALRTGIMAGTTCPVDVMRRVMGGGSNSDNDGSGGGGSGGSGGSGMNMRDVTICYGMTETSPVSFQSSAADAPELRAETVGRVHPHVECKVVGLDGETLPRAPRRRSTTGAGAGAAEEDEEDEAAAEKEGESEGGCGGSGSGATDERFAGELWTRGYVVFDGYWGEPQRTAEAVTAEGWMKTGDLATIDEDGYCRIVGRLKDVIIRGGENVFPSEVENILQGSPLVSSVLAVGVPSPLYGEEVCVWAVPSAAGVALVAAADAAEGGSGSGTGALREALRAHVRAHAARYKVPAHVLLVAEEDIPMTVSGKPQKFLMRERSVAMLGL